MLELEDALQRILAVLPPQTKERTAIWNAAGRVVAETVSSSVDLPPFDNSAMDGYAVRALDVERATVERPVPLSQRGRVAAGEMFGGEVSHGQCVRLFTGSPLPRGADAVVMQEDTRVDAGKADGVLVCDAVKSGENVRRRGSDLEQGAILVKEGEVLNAGRIGLLSATGVTTIETGRPPRVGLLATGSELLEAGKPLAPGQIYESNRIVLDVLVRRAGGIPTCFPLVADTASATRDALDAALSSCDVVVTSGGVSVGEMDFVKAAFEQLGGELQFWKVAIRPGRPFAFGRLREKFLFGLPGNPVSAFVTFLLLVRPAILRWQGAADVALPALPGVMAEPLANPGERRHYMRVRLDNTGKVFSAGAQASHALRSLAAANGLVDVAPRTVLAAGTTVTVLRWE